MTEIKAVLPLHDTLEALRGVMRVRLVEPDLRNRDHLDALRLINVQSADAGQLSFESLKPEPMSDKAVARWAKKEFGDFKLVSKLLYHGDRIIGEEHDYIDTHIEDSNAKLEEKGESLRIDPATHVETCTFIMEHTRDRDQMDEYTSLMQLVDIFGLDTAGGSPRNIQTAAMYMDGVTLEDRAMAKRVGYAKSVDGIMYEDKSKNTMFLATPESTMRAVYAYAKRLGISAAGPSGSRR